MAETRVSVVGTSGSGKTTVGRAIASVRGLPFLELDSIRHQANWQELPDDAFVERTREFTSGEGWVVDGNYDVVSAVVLERATEIVWLDLPKRTVMLQVIWRSLQRGVSRRPLWNDNRERFRDWFDPTHPIRWAWSTHPERRSRYEERFADDERLTRLRSRAEIRAYLR